MMKKAIIVLVISFFIGLTVVYGYSYFINNKITREFLTDLSNSIIPPNHPQEDLLIELIEVGLHNKIKIDSGGLRNLGLRSKLKLEVEDNIFNFRAKISKVGSKRFVILENIKIVTGYLMEVEEAQGEFIYTLQNNVNNVSISTPMDFSKDHMDVIRFILVGERAAAISPLEEVNISKILYYNSTSITGELEGTFNFADNIMFFGKENRLYIGQKNVDVYIKGGAVIGIITREEFVPDTIRVLINDTGFKNLNHSQIDLYSEEKIIIYCKINKETLEVDRGVILSFEEEGNTVVLTFSGEKRQYNGRVYLKSKGRFYFNNIKRGGNNPIRIGYRGNLEIFVQDGKLYLVNELPLEQYLYGVIPSEMPLSFGLEALKIQAIAARTYAINNVYSAPFRSFSAHVVDSIMNQIYNNTRENELSNEAVDATKGKVITCKGRIIDAKFFSTSWGHTANSHEVWEQNGDFPAKKIPYLISKPQGLTSGYSVETEEEFRDLITDLSIDSFDRQSPFYRWSFEMTQEQLRESIEANLKDRYKADPNRILTYDGNRFVSKEISDNPLGEIFELKVVNRGQGGNITHLDIVAQKGIYRIEKEFNIRFTIRPVCHINPVIIKRIDGSVLTNYNILPSAFVYFEHKFNHGKLDKIVFHGGGNGHGVGMSQYGVVEMVKRGYTVEEIIAHYYHGGEIKKLY